MIDVADGAHVDVRLRPVELLFRHRSNSSGHSALRPRRPGAPRGQNSSRRKKRGPKAAREKPGAPWSRVELAKARPLARTIRCGFPPCRGRFAGVVPSRHGRQPEWSRDCAATPRARCATTPPRASSTRPTRASTGGCPLADPAGAGRRRPGRRARRLPRARRAAHDARRRDEPRGPGRGRGAGGGLLGARDGRDRPGDADGARRSRRGARRPERRGRAAHGLAFGPDVASGSRATLGGMIANNSAGARSIAYGLTADHVLALEVTLADGTRATLRRGAPGARRPGGGPAAGARPRGRRRLLRRVSGYDLGRARRRRPRLAPPALRLGGHARGDPRRPSCALVERPAARGLALLAFPSVDAALEAAVEALEARPVGGGADGPLGARPRRPGPAADRAERRAGRGGRPPARGPRARGWCSTRPSRRRSGRCAGRGSAAPCATAPPGPGDPRPLRLHRGPGRPARAAARAGARRAPDPRARGPATAVWYGHASVGCLHIRPRMDLRLPGAVAALRRIAEETADLVCALGGSLSGEHGDGRARSELLPRMYPPETIAAFGELKRLLDPGRPAQPRRHRRPRAARRGPAPGRLAAAPGRGAPR